MDWDDVESNAMLRMLKARRSDYERDDVASEAMSRGLDALEELQRKGLLPQPPKPTEDPQ